MAAAADDPRLAYREGYDAAGAPEGEERLLPKDVGAQLYGWFQEIDKARYMAELEWLADLRQFKGEYDEREKPDEDASQAFWRLTRTKVRSVDARMADMLFPGGGDKNWDIAPSPVPELPPEEMQQIRLGMAVEAMQMLEQQLAQLPPAVLASMEQNGELPNIDMARAMLQRGEVPSQFAPNPEAFLERVREIAGQRAELMSEEIDDQLTEGEYVPAVRRVLHSGHLYGTGWLKGPLVAERTVTAWRKNPESGQWRADKRRVEAPFWTFVPIWDLYPTDIDMPDVADQEGFWQRYVMNRPQLRALAKQPGFDAEAIRYCLTQYKDGNYQPKHWEEELRQIRREDQGTIDNRRRRYEVLEYNGWMDGERLAECGCEIPEESRHLEFKAQIWLIGSNVIKADLAPYEDDGVQLYHRYVFEESDTGIYGTSIPSTMRDTQGIANASIRALLDNLGFSAGPITEIDYDLIDASEYAKAHDIHARKTVMKRSGGDPEKMRASVYHFHELKSYTSEFQKLAEWARQLGDEATALPSYTHGEQDEGVSRTVGGLSMLMGQSNIVLKDPVRNFDQGITEPFVTGLYHWNMQFNERDEVKGDYEVKATGSTALVAKEIRAQALENFALGTNNPADAIWIKRGELNAERARVLDLDPDRFVRTEEEVRLLQQQQMAAEQAAQGSGAAPPQGTPA